MTKRSSATLAALAVLAAATSTSDPAKAQAADAFELPPLAERQDVEATIAYGENENTRRVALRAWRLFQDAWRDGEWGEFMEITTEDFQFYFPNPPFAGMHEGDQGRAMLQRFATANKEAGYLIRGVTFATTIAGNRAVFEVQSAGVSDNGYRNVEAIVLEVEGDRISALREYWLVLDPSNTAIRQPVER